MRPKLSDSEITSSSQLLYSREQARRILGGVSISTIIRMEKTGALSPVRLNRQAAHGQVFYRADDIARLAK